MLVLGLDPSSTSTGFGLVRRQAQGLSFVDCGCFRPPVKSSFAGRLATLYDGLRDLLGSARPDAVALETSFYGLDADAATKLGEARGVLRLALFQAELETALYTPAEVKKAIVGNGRASKEQVQFMVGRLLNMESPPKSLDASDALAVAVCHLNRGARGTATAAVAQRRPEVEALLRRVSSR